MGESLGRCQSLTCELCAHLCNVEMSWQHFVQLLINIHHWFNCMVLCHTLLRVIMLVK